MRIILYIYNIIIDISANPLDLMYFTNSSAFKKINIKKSMEKDIGYEKDLLFYRKRILQKTKNFLRNEETDESLKRLFKGYSTTLIEHFKFVDKKDIIQRDYKNLGEKNNSRMNKNFEMQEQNKLMMKDKKGKEKSKIESFIDIKFHKNSKEEEKYIPQKKVINISLDELKTKGVKNKSK